jgi:hypothetical protein
MTTASVPEEASDPTEPTTVGEDRVTLVWNGLAELTTRLDGTEDAVAAALDTLTGAVADLKTQLAQLLAKEREKDVPPRRWADRATRKDWDASSPGSMSSTRATHCSATTPSRHAGPRTPASSRTSPAHHAWKIAVINNELGNQTGSNNLTAWHDRWLWPCLRRMKSGHYRTTNCRDRHHREVGTAARTDRGFLPNSR